MQTIFPMDAPADQSSRGASLGDPEVGVGREAACGNDAVDQRAPALTPAATRFAPRRVLYVVSQFPSLSETFIVREIGALIEQGIDVRVLSLKASKETIVQDQASKLLDRALYPVGLLHSIVAALVAVLRQPGVMTSFLVTLVRELWRRPVIFAKSLVAGFRALGRMDDIRRYEPELIHATWATYPATVAWLLSRALGRPFSFTSRAHDIFIDDHMMARKLDAAALAVTITEHNVRFMSKWVPATRAKPIRVVHSSLNLKEFPFSRSGRMPGKLLSVGRLVPMKGFDVLLSALAELNARGETFSCTIIGEGPERARLEALRSSLGLEGVVDLPGAMLQAEVARHMTDATLMVLPCVVAPNGQSDGIPNVLMEAMASGLPVISTRVSGIPELVEDGVSGRLVEKGDAGQLAQAIGALLADAERQDAFARAGRSKVEQDFNVQIEAGRLLAHFREACRG